MKRLISIIIFTFLCISVFSQKLTIESFTENTFDLAASTNLRKDANGNPCALLRIEILLPDVKFEGNVIGDVEHKVNEYWVYMSEGSKHLKVRHPSYYSCNIVFADYGINSLKGKTTYDVVLVKAEQANNNATANVISQPQTPQSQDHVAVDLGLSVKWATCNVGATRPEEYGDYFAWGETEPKSIYKWSTYKWCKGFQNTLTKYCTNGSAGTADNKTVLDPEDDAAHANWTGSWRMPTDAELGELMTKCIWIWTTQNGVNGYKVVGPNGNSIFFPAAGYCGDGTLGKAGSYGGCWSSSLSSSYMSECARGLDFGPKINVDRYTTNRYCGFSVRAVCQ